MEQERTQEIKLGEHTYTVVAQRHAYLQRELGPRIQETLDLTGGDTASMIKAGTVGYHSLLSVFIPDLMALWEWEGFASQTAMDGDQYDKEADKSPTIDQMVIAFKAVASVNRLDLATKLKELVGPDFFASDLWRAVRARGEVELIGRLTQIGEPSSGSLQPQNGESAQTSGGTSAPTPVESVGGPTHASSTT